MNGPNHGYYGEVRRRFADHGLAITELAYGPRKNIPSHACPGFFMPIDAAFVEGWTSTSYRLEAGDVSYHPEHEAYRLDTPPDQSRGFAVNLSERWRRCHGIDSSPNERPLNLSHTKISWLVARLFVELGSHDTARPLVVESLGLEMCAELAAMHLRAERRIPQWFVKLRDLMVSRLNASVTLVQLSTEAGVSAVAVVKAFRRLEGMTPGDFVRHARLVMARRALATTDRPLSAISVEAGFYDQSHFSRAFTRAMGTSPAIYCRLVRRNG